MPQTLNYMPNPEPQIAKVLDSFSMGGELITAAAVLFTRAADLQENIDTLTGSMTVSRDAMLCCAVLLCAGHL